MKTAKNITYVNAKHAFRIAVVVGVILLVPLVLTWTGSGIEGQGWYWTPRDFVFGFVMLFGTGLAIDYTVRRFKAPVHRAIAVSGIILAFLIIWVEMAVGIFD